MRELSVQASNDTNVSADRTAIQKELTALTSEVDRISADTEFNTMKLINGDLAAAGAMNLQVGANANQKISFGIQNMSSTGLSVTATEVKVSTHLEAEASVTAIQGALDLVSAERSGLGALQNRLEHTIANADNTAENLQAAESRIRDVDMAKEMVKFSKDSILQQAAQSMLAQANQQTQGVLALLQ
jgi:flagellin